MAVVRSKLHPHSHEQFDETLNVLSVSTTSVIPESASGGYPESRENNSLLDTGSRLRLVRYDVWSFFQAFPKCRGMENAWELSMLG